MVAGAVTLCRPPLLLCVCSRNVVRGVVVVLLVIPTLNKKSVLFCTTNTVLYKSTPYRIYRSCIA